MEKSLTYKNVTKKDAEDVGLPLELLKEWLKIMGQMSQWFKDNNMKVKHDGNGVFIYNGFQITLNFINNKYLELRVEKRKQDLLTIKHAGDVKLLLHCLVAVIAHHTKTQHRKTSN